MIKYNETVNENIHADVLPSGVKCYIIPKKGFAEKQAMVAVSYGSCDDSYIVSGETKETPEGVAHFLEHKLFEEEDGNAFDKFSALGGNANAFTNFNSTAYYFNTTESFDDNFKLLLSFVSKPYFTDENVAKEKSIISQEINMYEDNPMWRIHFNMLKSMYHKHPVRHNIAGTIDSISNIGKDLLYECYNNFYTPCNTVIVCAGDVNPESICEMADKFLTLPENKAVERNYGDEPNAVAAEYIEAKMNIDRPMFHFGFKETDFDTPVLKKSAATKILLDIIIGEGSEAYESLYQKGLIDDSFSFEYLSAMSYGQSVLSGFSDNPGEIESYLFERLDGLKSNGISEADFSRIRNKHIGRFIRGFNTIDAICMGQIDYFLKDADLFDAVDSYMGLGLDFINDRLRSHFIKEAMVTSLVLP